MATDTNFTPENFIGLAINFSEMYGRPLNVKSGPYKNDLDADSIRTLNNPERWMSVSDEVIANLKLHVKNATGLVPKTMRPVLNELDGSVPHALRHRTVRMRDGKIRFIVLATLDTGANALIVFERGNKTHTVYEQEKHISVYGPAKYNAFIY